VPRQDWQGFTLNHTKPRAFIISLKKSDGIGYKQDKITYRFYKGKVFIVEGVGFVGRKENGSAKQRIRSWEREKLEIGG
jgi:hypothetical protein